MSAASIGIGGALAALDGAAGAMSMRAWMELHHDELLAHQDGRQINWKALCAWFTSAGLVNTKGEVPTITCAKKTWYRVGQWRGRRNKRANARAVGA